MTRISDWHVYRLTITSLFKCCQQELLLNQTGMLFKVVNRIIQILTNYWLVIMKDLFVPLFVFFHLLWDMDAENREVISESIIRPIEKLFVSNNPTQAIYLLIPKKSLPLNFFLSFQLPNNIKHARNMHFWTKKQSTILSNRPFEICNFFLSDFLGIYIWNTLRIIHRLKIKWILAWKIYTWIGKYNPL